MIIMGTKTALKITIAKKIFPIVFFSFLLFTKNVTNKITKIVIPSARTMVAKAVTAKEP